jgi:hypothetical protein
MWQYGFDCAGSAFTLETITAYDDAYRVVDDLPYKRPWRPLNTLGPSGFFHHAEEVICGRAAARTYAAPRLDAVDWREALAKALSARTRP